MIEKIGDRGVTFDDVLLEPRWSEIVPSQVDVKTRLTSSIQLNIPLLSAPMDTVTESRMAIALAQEGGLGIIHKNLPVDLQADEVAKVKRSANGIIPNPATLPPGATLRQAHELMEKSRVSGVPLLRGMDVYAAFSRGVISASRKTSIRRSET